MTIEERQVSIAYADMLDIGETLQHILQIGAFDRLSDKAKKAFIEAEYRLMDVKYDLYAYMAEHTDWGDTSQKGTGDEPEHKD